MWLKPSQNPLETPSRKKRTSCWLEWLANISVHALGDNGVDITQADSGLLGAAVEAAGIFCHFSSHVVSGRMSWESPIGSMSSTSVQQQ